MSDKSDVEVVLDIVKELGGLWREMKACDLDAKAKVKPPQCAIFDKALFTRQRALETCRKCDLSIGVVRETERFYYVEQFPKDPNGSYTCIESGEGVQLIIEQ